MAMAMSWRWQPRSGLAIGPDGQCTRGRHVDFGFSSTHASMVRHARPACAQGGSDAEYEGDELAAAAAAAAWQPDPVDVDARRPARARRSADIISMLVAIYGSKELFISEYRHALDALCLLRAVRISRIVARVIIAPQAL